MEFTESVKIFPRSGDAGHVGLTTQSSFSSYFAGHARYFTGEPVELVHHGVECFFELKNFAAHVHGDLAGEIAVRNGGCYFSDVTYLASQVAGHEVNVVSKIFPRSGDTGHLRLATEFSFGSHFAGLRALLLRRNAFS